MVRKPSFERVDIPPFELTDRDEEIIRIVARHRFITSTLIIALICEMYPGSSEQKILRRLETLFHGQYLSRPRAQRRSYQGSTPMIYGIDNKGAELLEKKFGVRRATVDWTAKARTTTRGQLDHTLSTTDCLVALELACLRRGTLEVISFGEILQTLAPPETRENPRPYHWPVKVHFGNRDTTLYTIPDKTFGVRDRNRPAPKNEKFFFLENDNGTMPTVRLDLSKTSFLRKLLSYGTSYREDLHIKLYGLSNFRLLTVAPGRKRIDNIIAAHQQHTKSLCSPKLFLFADRPGLLAAPDFLEYQWTDAAGERHRLLD